MKKTKIPNDIRIGVIGGSGLYNIETIKNVKEVSLTTPFGKPSDSFVIGELGGKKIAFLPRHGRGHRILPSEINSHANIYGFKMLGVKILISVSACGSLKEEIKPKDFVLPDQIFDRTKFRNSTFFGGGIVGHISFDEPFCYETRKLIFDACKQLNINTHFGGTYVCIEGPQFSTKAESNVNRQHGFSVVGMTAIPEAKLAREAEMCYAMIALTTDYDVWKEGEEVTISKVVENLNANIRNVKSLLSLVFSKISPEKKCACNEALKYAIFTKKDMIKPSTIKKIKLIVGDYL